jgi:transposase
MGYSFLKGSRMSKFSEVERKKLLSNKYVQKVTDTQVLFTSEFKIKAIELFSQGFSPEKVFLKLEIDTSLFLPAFPKKSITRWRKIYKEYGVEGLIQENRGRNSTGRPKKTKTTSDLKSLQEKIEQLEAENFVLKKLHALAADYEKKKNSK